MIDCQDIDLIQWSKMKICSLRKNSDQGIRIVNPDYLVQCNSLVRVHIIGENEYYFTHKKKQFLKILLIQAGVSISIEEIEEDAVELKTFATKTAQHKRKRKQGLHERPTTSDAVEFSLVTTIKFVLLVSMR